MNFTIEDIQKVNKMLAADQKVVYDKLLNEEWKNILNYGVQYQVSSLGRVRSVIDNYGTKIKFIKKYSKNKVTGYLQVNMAINKKPKTFPIHRLVAIAFVSNPFKLKVVNHIDGNKVNNRFDNLEWCTYSENIQHAYDIGLRDPKTNGVFGGKNKLAIKIIQKNLDGSIVKIWDCMSDAHREGGFSTSTIAKVAKKKFYQHKGFMWEYLKTKEDEQ